jgi:hypothetical protein
MRGNCSAADCADGESPKRFVRHGHCRSTWVVSRICSYTLIRDKIGELDSTSRTCIQCVRIEKKVTRDWERCKWFHAHKNFKDLVVHSPHFDVTNGTWEYQASRLEPC